MREWVQFDERRGAARENIRELCVPLLSANYVGNQSNMAKSSYLMIINH